MTIYHALRRAKQIPQFNPQLNGALPQPMHDNGNHRGFVRDTQHPAQLRALGRLIFDSEIRNLGGGIEESGRNLGGKNIGLILLAEYLIDGGPGQYPNVSIFLPKTKMIGASFFYTYVESNPELKKMLMLKDKKVGYGPEDYLEIKNAFMAGRMPKEIIYELVVLLQKTSSDFQIVRSSASCEDGRLPSAGLFESLFLYNDPDIPIIKRAKDLGDVMKEVWASLFAPDAIKMMKNFGLDPLGESMSLVIQPVVGNWHGKYYFPLFSGVFKSRNLWPWDAEIERTDPVGRFGMGLGTFMVGDTGGFKEGGPRLISIGKDGYMRQFSGDWIDADSISGAGGTPHLRNDDPDYGQTYIDVLSVQNRAGGKRAAVVTVPLFYNTLRDDNQAGVAASMPYDLMKLMASFRNSGTVATFDAIEMENWVRRGTLFPIWPMLNRAMRDLREITGDDISMEFAVKAVPGANGAPHFEFYFLQVRPQTTHADDERITLTIVSEAGFSVLARSSSSFGHKAGSVEQAFVLTNEIAAIIGRDRARVLMKEMDDFHRGNYILIGTDADAFVGGNDAFENFYGGVQPSVVLSIKTPQGIVSLINAYGSHTSDNLERTPTIIQDGDRMEAGLRGLVSEIRARVAGKKPEDVTFKDLVFEKQITFELDGMTGKGQIFYPREKPSEPRIEGPRT